MEFRDYYKILGVERSATRRPDQDRLPAAGAQVPPRREQGKERRGALQGDAGGVRGAEGPAEARRLRPARQRLEVRAAVPAAAGLGQRFEHAGPGPRTRRRRPARAASGDGARTAGGVQRLLLLALRRGDALRRGRRAVPRRRATTTRASTSISRRRFAARRARSSCAVRRSNPTARVELRHAHRAGHDPGGRDRGTADTPCRPG